MTFTHVSVAAVTAEPYRILHVSVRFQLKETTVSTSVTSCEHVRKHIITFRKPEFSISVDVITSKRSRKCKITFRFSLVSVNVVRPKLT